VEIKEGFPLNPNALIGIELKGVKFPIGGACVRIRELPRRLRRGVAKQPRIWVGNPDALYRDFSPNSLNDILRFHTVSGDWELDKKPMTIYTSPSVPPLSPSP